VRGQPQHPAVRAPLSQRAIAVARSTTRRHRPCRSGASPASRIVRQLVDAQLGQGDDAIRPQDLELHVAWIRAARMGDLVDERVDREGVEDVVHERSQPMRTCTSARQVSARTWRSPAAVVTPCCRSPALGWLVGEKVEEMGGNAVRSRQAMSLPRSSSPAVSNWVFTAL